MKYLIIFILSLNAYADLHIPHLPLELTFEESQKLYQSLPSTQKNTKDPYIQASIDGGEKLSQWIDLINSNRSEGDAIRLTSKSTQRGIPIDKPSKYGPSVIQSRLSTLQGDMPKEMKEIIYGKASIVNTPIVSDADFVTWGRKVSRLYQTAVRWESYQPWLGQMAQRRYRDVRGYYHLTKIKDLDYQLNNYGTLSGEEAKHLREALYGICLNYAQSEKDCDKNLRAAIKGNSLVNFKNRYFNWAGKIWKSFFTISNPRKDVKWEDENLMQVVFKDPKNETIKDWLKVNVEDEFKWDGWNLEMKFKKFGFGLSHIEFKKNVTPHVSGGNKIVMDANTPLEEYGVKWTIRHEYGHILRIPDCYHEFYDKEQNLMINYQLDTTDLMCSRAGSMNERIYKELKRVYFKQ